MKLLKTTNGFATLPAVLALSVLILVVATGIATSTFTETVTTSIEGQSIQALRYAEAGAKDALMRITRKKSYSCSTTDCYSLDMVANGCTNNNGCAKMSISAGTGTSSDPKIIVAKGIMQNKTREVEVRVVYDSLSYGEISSITWSELTTN
jgi:hypothetical protein